MKTKTQVIQNSLVLRKPSLAPSQYQLESILNYAVTEGHRGSFLLHTLHNVSSSHVLTQ